MKRNDDFLYIEDTSDDTCKRLVLHVGRDEDALHLERRCVVTQAANGDVTYNVDFAGPVQWEEMKLILVGMVELGMMAEQLQHRVEVKRGRKKS